MLRIDQLFKRNRNIYIKKNKLKVLLKESGRERKTAGKNVLSDLIKQETLEYFMMQLFCGKNHIILALQKSSK